MRIAVLGCGWSGAVTSIRMKSKYPSADIICIDKTFDGGLLKTEVVDGYIFDVGGSHVLFSKDRNVINEIISLGGRWATKQRRSFVLLDGAFIPYPFENGIYILPPEKRARYGLSLIRAIMHGDRRPENLKEWIINTFGEEVANDYLIPYNEKIWKRSLEDISVDWVYIPGRLPLPSLEDIVKAIAGIETIGYKDQATFYYPDGGIVNMYYSVLRKAESLGVILVKEEVKELKRTSDGFLINNHLKVDRVISTLPLNEVPRILSPQPPDEVLAATGRLEYNSVLVVGIGLKMKAPPQHWIYVPDKRVIFHRYAWISNYLPEPPEDKASLIAEIMVPPGHNINIENLVDETKKGLIELGVVSENNVEVTKVWFHKYGYPVYTKTHSTDREIIERYLGELGIKTFGRWGNWHYWNTDVIYKKSAEII